MKFNFYSLFFNNIKLKVNIINIFIDNIKVLFTFVLNIDKYATKTSSPMSQLY